MDTADIVRFLREHVELFEKFPDDALQQTVQSSRVTTFEPNEAVIEFGSEGRFLGVLLQGEAEVSVADNAGRRTRLAQLEPGDVFGEMSLMTGDRTVADVIGIRRCTALLIPRDLFSEILGSHPQAIQYLSRILTQRSRDIAFDERRRDLNSEAIARSPDPYGFSLNTDTPVKMLVVNCGSSSLKYCLYDTTDGAVVAEGMVERIGLAGMRHTSRVGERQTVNELGNADHSKAFAAMVEALTGSVIASVDDIAAVGHRVVHGGERFAGPTVIDDTVLRNIEKLAAFSPLHNPVNLSGIREAQAAFPGAVHVAVFDTSFHHTLPPYAYLYGLPYEQYEKNGVRRYGFHGMSHFYVALRASQFLQRPFNELEIISCHLGNGASICAVDHGRSVDTSMGLTPVEGLVMGTRCGNIDPAALLHVMRSENLDADQADTLINKQSGLLGLSGISSDMREIEEAANKGDHRALLAIKTFCYGIRKYIGSYVAAMQGLDVVIFTGGIGQNSSGVRSLACQGLACMGIAIDEEKNRDAVHAGEVRDISAESSSVRILVVPTDEERMIARETLRSLDLRGLGAIVERRRQEPIPIEVSAHHVHLSREHVEALFGEGYELTPAADLSQPGQFAAKEHVSLVGPKGRVDRVRVLGPARKQSQVEIAMTEQFKLGIHPPVRESGDLDNTPGITLEGPKGTVELSQGVICAMRHIHMPPQDALKFGLRDKYVVRIRVEGDRELVFGDVLVRVSPTYRLAMHLDTDEANAANLRTGMIGHVDGIQSRE